jgi:hypothetical protein
MNKIFHPVSGEEGYFCSEKEKIVIDTILFDWNSKNLVVNDESSTVNSRGVEQ